VAGVLGPRSRLRIGSHAPTQNAFRPGLCFELAGGLYSDPPGPTKLREPLCSKNDGIGGVQKGGRKHTNGSVARYNIYGIKGVGLVIERSRVRFPAGALPGNLGELSLPSLWGR